MTIFPFQVAAVALFFLSSVVPQQTAEIIDATKEFQPSTESLYDHMVSLEENLSFHWSTTSQGDFVGRMIHRADSQTQAPTWLGFGVYHSNHNYSSLPSSNLMVGSSAWIGIVDAPETQSPAQLYRLPSTRVEDIIEAPGNVTSFSYAVVLQHVVDNGSVVTELSFSKSIHSRDDQGELRTEGANVFLWAVGRPGTSAGILGKHALKGGLYLDFSKVQQAILESQSSTNSKGAHAPSEDVRGSDESGQESLPMLPASCGSTYLNGPNTGHATLTPTLEFHWRILELKVEIALVHTGAQNWLGVATSFDGTMIGALAVIGIPGQTPKHFILAGRDMSTVTMDPSVVLEDASFISTQSIANTPEHVSVLRFTKGTMDEKDPVPISSGTTTFLYAVGSSDILAYHEHRGVFRLDLEECGGKILSLQDEIEWTYQRLFVSHGILAALAFGVVTPYAVSLAWFRSFAPSSWIYIHVFANTFTVIATLVSFVLAVVGIAKQRRAFHFASSHHWVGAFLCLAVTVQALSGFLRPPVERKEPSQATRRRVSIGSLSIPASRRECWHLLHRYGGLTVLVMSIYEVQSGLRLYAQRFHTVSLVEYYFLYVLMIICGLVVLKVYLCLSDHNARTVGMEEVNTSEPDSDAEEPTANTVGEFT